MKTNIYILFLIAFFFCNNLQAQKNSLKPKHTTKINLDILTKSIETKRIPVKIVFSVSRNKNDKTSDSVSKIFPLSRMIEGPDNSIYILNYGLNRLVQFDENFRLIKSMGSSGKNPGELNKPFYIDNRNNNIYICDDMGKRMQIFDINGIFLKEIRNPEFLATLFAFGKNGRIITLPISDMACPVNDKSYEKKNTFKNLVSIWDSSLVEEKKSLFVSSDNPFFFEKNRKKSFYIQASDNSPYIWIVLQAAPKIYKYDYNGNFIEEITFSGKKISEMSKTNKSYSAKYKDQDVSREVIIIDHAFLLPNGDLIVKIMGYGNIQISGNNEKAAVTKRYKFFIPDKNSPFLNNFNLIILHNKYYGFNHNTVCKELYK